MPFHYLPQAEEGTPTGPRQPRADRCPPPPQTLPPGACQATRCHADSECPRHRRCCYNGCAYACLEAVPPPPGELSWVRGLEVVWIQCWAEEEKELSCVCAELPAAQPGCSPAAFSCNSAIPAGCNCLNFMHGASPAWNIYTPGITSPL